MPMSCTTAHCLLPTEGVSMVRITKIHATTASMQSDIRNAYVDFTQMTTSVVAVVTDVVRHGKPVIGYGFNSNGRYAATGTAQGAVRAAPRTRRAGVAHQRRGGQSRPAPHLADDDDGRETGRPRRAGRRGRHRRYGRLGRAWRRSRRSRSTACSPTATAMARRTSGSSSMRRAATISRTRTSAPCKTRCAATSTSATRSSR